VHNNKSLVLGISLIAFSLTFLVSYAWLIFFSKWAFLTLQITCFTMIVVFVGLLTWIGKTLIIAKKIGEEMES
jgi:hypothetical protein